MSEIRKSIEVDAPVETVYRFWSDLSNLPRFMENVKNVNVTGPSTSHWEVSIAGRKMEWDATQDFQPNRQVSWRAQGDVKHQGTVRFEGLGNRTRVEVTMLTEPQGAMERVGQALNLDDRAVQRDLENFKEVIEGRTGGTSGTVGTVGP